MQELHDVPLAGLTTLRVGGPAKRVLVAESESELIEAVADCDDLGEPLLILGGGSNLVVSDDGPAGLVVKVATAGIEVADSSECAGVTVQVAAGELWDDVVARAVAEGWVGIEALSGIPGLAGATPIQNVGAYGQEVAQTIAGVRTYDRAERAVRTFAAADCGFGYRTSRFKGSGRYVVLSVELQLPTGTLGAPIAYAELARALGVDEGGRAPLAQVREAVLALRRSKGMVLDAADHDTWSAGSFFTNPVLPAAEADRLPPDAPRWPQPDGSVKTSAAWLIEHSGFAKGYGGGPARLSTKHTLAITNRGRATASDVVALADEIRGTVQVKHGVRLEAEPTLVGLSLDAASDADPTAPQAPQTQREVLLGRIRICREVATFSAAAAFLAGIANLVIRGAEGDQPPGAAARASALVAVLAIVSAFVGVIAGARVRKQLHKHLRADGGRPDPDPTSGG